MKIAAHYGIGEHKALPACGMSITEYTTRRIKVVDCTNCKRTKAYKEACARVSGKVRK